MSTLSLPLARRRGARRSRTLRAVLLATCATLVVACGGNPNGTDVTPRDGTTLPDGNTLPDGTTLPDGATEPDVTTNPDATTNPDVTMGTDGSTMPDATMGTDGSTMPDGATADAGPCTEGALRCGPSNEAQVCRAGLFVTTANCPFGCTAGACTTMVMCTAGQYRCNGEQVEICNASGSAFLHTATCSVMCSAGLCTGMCTPGERRCNGMAAETCNPDGRAWTVAETCSTFCDSGRCALDRLEVTANRDLDGTVVVAGAVIVRSGATLNSPTGNLTIRAQSITVENGASIAAAPTGNNPQGTGGIGRFCSGGFNGGGGGGYGTAGTIGMVGSSGTPCSAGGRAFGSDTHAEVEQGSAGGAVMTGTAMGARGGGVVRLIAATTITIAGQVTANGAAGMRDPGSSGLSTGGGSGGGILIAGDDVTVTGSVSAVGGGSTGYGGTGGNGRVRVLSGSRRSVTGTISGSVTQGLLPPLAITSSTHPDPARFYNDDFATLGVTWNPAFPSRQGYYYRVDATAFGPPTPATGRLTLTELAAIDRATLVAGNNYFHIVSVDSSSAIGTVENTFRVQLNTTPPPVTSTSHPSQTTWSTNHDVFYQWTAPNGDENYRGFYYVLDHYGETVPTRDATFLPVTQHQIIRSALADGIWGFHVVSLDTRGYLTRTAGNYVVRLGPDPGTGGLLGQVVGPSGNVSGARVTINRGLFPAQTTNATGNYNFMAVPAGMWEVEVTATGFRPETRPVTVTMGGSATLNVMLTPM